MNDILGEHVKWTAGDNVFEYLIGSISGGELEMSEEMTVFQYSHVNAEINRQ